MWAWASPTPANNAPEESPPAHPNNPTMSMPGASLRGRRRGGARRSARSRNNLGGDGREARLKVRSPWAAAAADAACAARSTCARS